MRKFIVTEIDLYDRSASECEFFEAETPKQAFKMFCDDTDFMVGMDEEEIENFIDDYWSRTSSDNMWMFDYDDTLHTIHLIPN